MKNIEVLIATPTYDHRIYVDTATSITNTIFELAQAKYRASTFYCGGGAIIQHVRNSIVAEFLSRKERTHLLFIDADMGWSPHTIMRMLKADLPFVAAPYVAKNYVNATTKAYQPRDLEAFHAATVSWNVTFEDQGIMKGEQKLTGVRQGFAKAIGVGAGVMLLRRDMLEQMLVKYADTEYRWAGNPDNTFSPNLRYYGLFDMMKDDNGFLASEDHSFCHRWVRGCGGEIWCDTEARISHHGYHKYSGSLQESLRLRARGDKVEN